MHPAARSLRARAIVSAVAAPLLLASACGEPTTAPGPAPLGDYGFLYERNDQFHVVGDPGGIDRTVLPEGVAGMMPDVSPDGSRLVFVHPVQQPAGGYRLEIATIRLDGTGMLALTGQAESGLAPRWAPDGVTVAFSMSSADNTYFDELVVVRPTGGAGVEHVIAGTWDDAKHVAWSPGGERIAFERGSTGIWVIDRDGTGLQRLTTEADGSPDWSPDGTRIAFDRLLGSGRQVCILTLGSGMETCLAVSGWASNPRWSPDGRWLAYIGDTGGLFTVEADGSSPVERITGAVMGSGDYDWVRLR